MPNSEEIFQNTGYQRVAYFGTHIKRWGKCGTSVEKFPKKVGNVHFPNSPLAWDDYIIRRSADRRHTPSCLSMRGQEYIEKVERVRSERARVRQEGKEILSEAERKTVP